MLLNSIDENTMIEVISKSILIIYKPNDLIYYQNSQPLNFFLILEGEIYFRKYSKVDLLAMIGGEENIIISKKYSKEQNTKMNKENLLNLRNKALFKGIEDKNNNKYLECGEFFGEENLLMNKTYDNCAIANKKSIILSINIDDFNFYLREKITKTKENIRSLILHRFSFFSQIERKQLNKYMDKIYKIFPKNGEIICKENELSNKLYLIFQGKCAVEKHSKNLGSILFLNKGDLFGYDSLIDLPLDYKQDQKIKIVKCEYTIVNKDDSTIILKLDIPFCDEFTTWRLNINLLNYFNIQKRIIQKYENYKNISTQLLQDEYIHLDIGKKASFDNYNDYHLKDLNRKYKKCFNKAVISEKNIFNSKKSNKRKVNLIFQSIKKCPKNYLYFLYDSKKNQNSPQEININKKNKVELFFNRFQNKNKKEDKYTTPIKNKKNMNILTSINLKNNQFGKNKTKSSSTISTNNISYNKSNNLRRFSTYNKMSNANGDKSMNRFISDKYKIIFKKNYTDSKIKIKKNKKPRNLYTTNDNRKCSKFESNVLFSFDECLPFILSQNANILLFSQNKFTFKKFEK